MLARTGRCRSVPVQRRNWEALTQKTVARETATATKKYLTGVAHLLRPRVGVKATPRNEKKSDDAGDDLSHPQRSLAGNRGGERIQEKVQQQEAHQGDEGEEV